MGIDYGPMTGQGTGTSVELTGLMDGSHVINVIASDKSGKVRAAHIDVFIDTVAPMLSITIPFEGGYFSVPDLNVTWTGMEFGSGLASYEVKVDGSEWQSRGTSLYAPLVLTEGRHAIHVRAIDVAGNSRSAVVNVTIDLNPAVINFLIPPDGSLVNTSNVVFSWNVTDVIGTTSVMYSIDNDAGHGLMEGVSSVSVAMTSGNHTFRLMVTDRAWRVVTGYVNLTVDAIAPTIVAHTPATSNAGTSDRISFRFSETVNNTGMSVLVNGEVCEFSLNGTTYEVTRTLVGGTNYTVAIAGARDLSGNSMLAYSWAFNVVSGEQSPGRFVIGGTVVNKNDQPISGATVTIGGQTLITNAHGQFSVYVDSGQQQLHVTASGMEGLDLSLTVTADQQLGHLTMTSIAESAGENGASITGGDMTMFLVIGILVAIGVLVLVMVVLRKRKA